MTTCRSIPFTEICHRDLHQAGGDRGGRLAETGDTLRFRAEHGIAAQVEVVDAQGIDTAYRRPREGDVRHRFAIDATTIDT